ncbi:MAG: dehydrogenase, partial [Anaerolineales bacterium]|nr:dehydrogenase [Anaerolineales bacterium]
MSSRTLTSKPVDPEIAALAERHHADPEAILAILQELQARHGGLTRAAIADVARALRLPVERAYGVATFYSMLNSPPRPRPTIRVCDGPACWLNSAQEARAAVEAEFGREWAVERTSCLGLCDRAPAALMDGQPFGPLLAENVLVERSRWLGEPKAYARPRPGEVRILLARAGKVDPDSLDSALAQGAYTSLLAAFNRPPEAVIAEVEAAGLTGRGGAGFPAGRKWRMVAQE